MNKSINKQDESFLQMIAEERQKLEKKHINNLKKAGLKHYTTPNFIKEREEDERQRARLAISFFIETWNKSDIKNFQDAHGRFFTFGEWCKRRFWLEDFLKFPEELLDLKKEYVALDNEELREWTLKKFVECYKEFLCREIHKVILYQQQPPTEYVKKKIAATHLGEDIDAPFSDFVDIPIVEDLFFEELPEYVSSEDAPLPYLRPKSWCGVSD